MSTVPGDGPPDGAFVALAVGTGAVDAVSFERLGHVFASVMTGNLVLLGVGAGAAEGRVAAAAGCSLGAYALGAGLGARLARWASLGLLVDLALLVLFTAGWELDGVRPARAVELLLLADVSAAMGLRAAVLRRLGSVSTTYLTGTLTGVLEAVALRRLTRDDVRSLAILLAALAGAALTVVLVDDARRAVPAAVLVPPLVMLATVVLQTARRSSAV